MNTKSFSIFVYILSLTASFSYSQISHSSWQAELSTDFHNVSGTVTIVDDDTIQLNNFNYDGAGLVVYFYLAQENTPASFSNGLAIGDDLLGTKFTNATFSINLPPGESTSNYNAISVWCVAAGVSFGSGSFTCPEKTTQYKVTFTGTWNPTDHPLNYPSNAHFSGIIGATHNSDISFWQPYTLVSKGIEDVAEIGSKAALTSEISLALSAGTAYSSISGNGLPNGYNISTSKTFNVSSCYPLVTLVSMVAPTPDWFVGVHDLPLYENGKWRDRIVITLYPWDAGTENGSGFSTNNTATEPQEINRRLVIPPFEQTTAPIAPLAYFTFERVDACPLYIPNDINSDCIIDLADFSSLAANWLLNCSGEPPLDLSCF